MKRTHLMPNVEGPAAAFGCPGPVWLLRTSSGFVVQEQARPSLTISEAEIQASKLLEESFHQCSTGSRVALHQSAGHLRAWHAHAHGRGDSRSSSEDQLLDVVQAADYLNDPQTLDDASARLASQVFPTALKPPPPAHTHDAPAQAARSAAAAKVLEALPEHLAVLVLRAALRDIPPCVGRSMLSVSSVPFEERRALRMHAVMGLLPAPLQPLVVRAHDPAVDSAAALSLTHAGADAAAATARAAAQGLSTQLTALSLHATLKHEHMRARVGAGAQFTHEDVRAAVEAVSQPLGHLRYLESLTFCVVTQCRPLLCVHTLSDVLPRLTRLTHLNVSRSAGAGPGLRGLTRSLPALRTLRVLDLSRGSVDGNHQDKAQLQALGDALRALTMLSSLSLAQNKLEGWRWDALAPAAAALPLRRLDLEMCGLGDGFDLFSGVGAGVGAAFARLEEIVLSKNNFTLSAPEFLGRLPQLAHLAMTRLPLSVGAEEKLLQDLVANEALRLHVLKLGQCNSGPVALAALCCGLERWTTLRCVSLSWRRGEAAAALPEIAPWLAELPVLHELYLGYACMLNAAAVPESLGRLTGLTSLRMLWLQCGVEGARELACRLRELSGLRALEIWCNPGECEASGGEELAACMHALSHLTLLNLDSLMLEAAGAERLADCLACMSCLHELRLARNAITPNGAKALAPALRPLCVLRVLELSRNRLGDDGASVLATVLPTLTAMRQLGLGACGMSETGKAAVLRALPPCMQSVVV
eukprot:jgi/Ulvmu1/2088/UM124_0003.1